MKPETLQKANDLTDQIKKLRSVIYPIYTLEERESDFKKQKSFIKIKATSDKYSNIESCLGEWINIPNSQINEEIEEEIQDCIERIKRKIEKLIKKLEKELEVL